MCNGKNKKIKVLKDGPYLVTGNVPIFEKVITPLGETYEYIDGHDLPQAETYTLCRCGKTKNPPFCDGTHAKEGFDGTETASMEKYEDRAEFMEGADLNLRDDNRCALARFCHMEDGNSVWELLGMSNDPESKEKAIRGASNCPAGRLVAMEKSGEIYENEYEPTIEILQDPEKRVSCAIAVKGNIPIESAEGIIYETRNRATLCRCGESKNKPFCDATHAIVNYIDKK